MAITDLGQLSAGGARTPDVSGVNVGTTAACAAGELVVVVVAVDNRAASASLDDISVSSVTFGGETFTKADGCSGNVAAQTGAACSVWWCVLASAKTSGTNITANFVNVPTSDHYALTARHFSIAGGVSVVGTARSYKDPAGTLPSMDVTTPNATHLRVRGIGLRYAPPNNTDLSATSGWTFWGNGNSNSSGGLIDWEIFARAEHHIVSGTSDPSAPLTSMTGINANVYVAFKELPITGTLVATDGSDTPSFSGISNSNPGTLEAYEGAVWLRADLTLYTADDNVTRINTATDTGDTASFTGRLSRVVTGTLAATETTTDTAAFAGAVRWPGHSRRRLKPLTQQHLQVDNLLAGCSGRH